MPPAGVKSNRFGLGIFSASKRDRICLKVEAMAKSPDTKATLVWCPLDFFLIGSVWLSCGSIKYLGNARQQATPSRSSS